MQNTPLSAEVNRATIHGKTGTPATTTGILLVNLGTPDSTSTGDVRRYLRQFLMDGRVLDINSAGRFALVNGIIAPFRAPKSAASYKKVWLEGGKGSPLKYYGLQVEKLLAQRLGPAYHVRLAMRYQNPSIETVVDEMLTHPLEKIIVIPLFPQYASASTGSVVEEVMRVLGKQLLVPSVDFVNRFSSREDYLQAFAQIARRTLQKGSTKGPYDFLLFSYHGLPERQILKTDTQQYCRLGDCCATFSEKNAYCYRAQCFENSRQLVRLLGWPEEQSATTFQSRLGSTPWIKPYTDDFLKEAASQGIKRIAAMSPSFVADCLETTLEIGEEYHELFLENGGEALDLIPSLNDDPAWIEVLANMVEERMPRQ